MFQKMLILSFEASMELLRSTLDIAQFFFQFEPTVLCVSLQKVIEYHEGKKSGRLLICHQYNHENILKTDTVIIELAFFSFVHEFWITNSKQNFQFNFTIIFLGKKPSRILNLENFWPKSTSINLNFKCIGVGEEQNKVYFLYSVCK